jgi:UDP-N-acetylmuramate--alanine ligase
MTHVHLIGIGGTGLAPIARILLDRGFAVSGSDRQSSPLTDELNRLGAVVYLGHHADQIHGADLVLRSSAIPDDNPEVQAANRAGVPVLKRNQFLPVLLEKDEVIAVAGTHGKTTTTAMLAWTLKSLGADPSFIIGSVALNLKTNAHVGQGQYFVIEADEYDDMFLGLAPRIAILTSLEYDHPDYFPTPERLYASFEKFLKQILPGGLCIACTDDPQVAALVEKLSAQDLTVLTYGIRSKSDYSASDLVPVENAGYTFKVDRRGQQIGSLSLQIPGEHNVLNALAVLAVMDQLGLPIQRAVGFLSAFQGTARRFEVSGERNGIVVVNDYAHHPTEIRATLQAARQKFPGKRIWAVWQPHTFSRTRKLLADFALSFDHADRVIITDIYPAREMPPDDGFSAKDVFQAIHHPAVDYIPELIATADFLSAALKPGDILLVLSAGDADLISRRVLETLPQPQKENHV